MMPLNFFKQKNDFSLFLNACFLLTSDAIPQILSNLELESNLNLHFLSSWLGSLWERADLNLVLRNMCDESLMLLLQNQLLVGVIRI